MSSKPMVSSRPVSTSDIRFDDGRPGSRRIWSQKLDSFIRKWYDIQSYNACSCI